jgi:hypothetical protein
MIQLQMLGLVGNNLFQYAFARILSEELCYALEVTHSPYKPRKNIPQLMALMSTFQDAPLSVPGRVYNRPEDRTAFLDHQGFDGFRVDLASMLANRDPRCIKVKGYFERYEIFRRHKDRIRAWYGVDPISCGYDIGPDDVVMHVRRGDFITFGRAITLTYYKDILDRLDFRKLYVCGFGLDPEVKEAFKRYRPIYVQGEPVDDFLFMKGFNRIIQSQSTFAWWAGFLSQAEEIHAPITIPGSGDFERAYPHIDLTVDDEPRYHYVVDVAHLEREFGVADVFRARQHLHLRDLKRLVVKWSRRAWTRRRQG